MLTILVTDSLAVAYFVFTGVLLVTALLTRSASGARKRGRSLPPPSVGAGHAATPAFCGEWAGGRPIPRWPAGRSLIASCSPDYTALFAEGIKKVRYPDACRTAR
jgi:hypothetical protein